MTRRAAISLLLAFVLAFSSLTLAQTRGAAAAAGQMVICSGTGTAVVYIDAEGQPTAAPHVCPECLVHLAVSHTAPSLGQPEQHVLTLQADTRTAQPDLHAPNLTPPARAPPLLF